MFALLIFIDQSALYFYFFLGRGEARGLCPQSRCSTISRSVRLLYLRSCSPAMPRSMSRGGNEMTENVSSREWNVSIGSELAISDSLATSQTSGSSTAQRISPGDVKGQDFSSRAGVGDLASDLEGSGILPYCGHETIAS